MEKTESSKAIKKKTLEGLAFIGMWKDRKDALDSLKFSRKLREESWKRNVLKKTFGTLKFPRSAQQIKNELRKELYND